MDLSSLTAILKTRLPPQLVDELLAAHQEIKRAFYLGGLRLAEVEGGRFCEAVFRILEHVTTGTYTPLGKTLDTETLIRTLGQLPSAKFNDSIRLHIPRSLRLVYDIRNKRDAAHLADGIDPNVQDSTLVCGVTDWILAELIRQFHNVTPDQAARIVGDLVKRVAPIIQEFDGFLKVLNPRLGASEYCLVLLYQRGDDGATFDELSGWVLPEMRANLKRTLTRLSDGKAFVHFAKGRYTITQAGEREVEKKRLFDPPK